MFWYWFSAVFIGIATALYFVESDSNVDFIKSNFVVKCLVALVIGAICGLCFPLLILLADASLIWNLVLYIKKMRGTLTLDDEEDINDLFPTPAPKVITADEGISTDPGNEAGDTAAVWENLNDSSSN